MFLTPAQLEELTGYVRHSAQVRALQKMGIPHNVRLDGRPVVVSTVLIPREKTPTAEPDFSALA